MAKVISEKLTRKNLIVNDSKVKQLRKTLGVRTESEAVRIAVDRALHARQAIEAFRRLRERGTIEDVYHRTEPPKE